MEENFQAIVGAHIRDFQRQMREVDRTIRETATGADANIGADIAGFMTDIATVNEMIDDVAREHNVDIDASIAGFNSQVSQVQEAIDEIARANPTVTINANTRSFTRQAAQVRAVASLIGSQRPTVTVEADTAIAATRIQAFMARMRALTARNIVVTIQSRWKNYQRVMGAIASFSRNLGEVMSMTARGITIAISPAIVPILASVVGLLGNLGPMIGTIGGSTFALGSAFATAGIGAAGFGAIAVTNLKDIFDVNEKLKKQQEALAKADTGKERTKILNEMSRLQGTLNKEQQKGLEAMGKLKETWSGIAGSLQTETIKIFTNTLGILSGVLKTLKPMFKSVTDSAGNLVDSLGKSFNAKPMQSFFEYLNKTAGPMLETIAKAAGNFLNGFFGMMVAFGPLATETSNGFLKMSESFAAWGASLGKNEKFQSFVSYVSENMPKIRSIFGDAMAGIVNTFAAFAPSSSDMMTSMQDMMARFRDWSSKLGENEGFKKFVDYFMTNGPKVLDAIGNITTFIINLGKALAPAGSQIMDIANSVMNFTNKLLESHAWIGKVITAGVVFGGIFLAALPNIVALNALLGGLITKLIVYVAKQAWAAVTTIANWVKMGVAATINAAKVVAGWVVMGVQATLNAIKVAAAWTLSTGIAMVTAIAKMTASAAIFVAKWLWMGAQALLHAAKVGAAWLLTTGVGMATALASMVATSAVFVAKWTWMAVQALAQGARMAAAWFIALGPIGWITAAVIGIAALIIANWDKISAWTTKTWSAVSQWISTKWSEITSKTSSAASSMWTTVSTKFSNIVNSVKDKMSQAKTAIQNKWEEAKSAAITKIAAMVTAVATKFAEIVSKVTSKMSEAKTALSNKWEEAKSATSSKLSNLVSTVTTFFGNVVSKVREKMAEAVTTLGTKVAEMPRKVLSFRGDMLSAGADLIRGLINGITNMGKGAIEAITGVVGGIVNKAKSLLKIHSPSRVMKEIGGFVGAGLAKGITGSSKQVADATAKMSNYIKDGISDNAASIIKNNKKIMDVTKTIKDQQKQVQLLQKERNRLAKKGASTFSIDKQLNNAKARVSKSKDSLYGVIANNRSLAKESEVMKSVQSLIKKQQGQLATIAKQRETVATKLKAARDKLTEAIKMRDDFAKSVQDNVMSFGSIGNVEATSGVDIAAEMKARLQAIKDFQANIKKLQESGLNDTTLQDIINAGVEGGGAQAAALAGSSSSVIKDINKTQNDINTRAKNLGKETAQQFYGVGVDSAKGMVKGLESQAKALEKSAKTISDALVKAVKKKLDIHSPSRVFASLGGFVSKGLANGVSQQAKSAVSAVTSMAAGMTNAFSPQLAMADMRASATLDTNIKRADMKAVKHSFAAELGSVDNHQPDIVLVMDGREVGRVTAPYVNKEINLQRNTKRRG